MSGLRYVVVVRSPDERVRVFGTFYEYARAEALAEKVNTAIERQEDEEFRAWRIRTNHLDHAYEMAPDGYGRAGVLIVHPPRVREALAAARGDEEARA